ncbi:MAG TPA: CsgG/HfaB family protein [Bryobacteraceae bacterium]|nr:CsgG/HfaB family protein [Bryobacteraceae bacterium]
MKHIATFVMAVACAYAGAAPDVKVGVLPFADATASGGAALGESLSRATQAEIVHSTQLEGRVVPLPAGLRTDQLDSEKIVGLGRDNHVDLIVLGTVLDAHAEQSSHSGSGPSIFGQSIGAGLHATKATVTLQADVYDVASGKKLESLRLSGAQSDRKVSGNVYTSLGSVDTSSPAFQTSTLGKAMQKAIADLVKRLDADASKTATTASAKVQ